MKKENNIFSHEPVMEIGTWRTLYKLFIEKLPLNSLCEVGCGHPSFLNSLDLQEKIAIDFGESFKADYLENEIKFINLDLDNDSLDTFNLDLDAAVCSDVFEHLLYPKKSLKFCYENLKTDGVFFSHVPNEFNIRRLIKVALLDSSSVFFHEGEEHSNPHLRRFTRQGYLGFLKKYFEHNLYISDLQYSGIKRYLSYLNIPIPYGFQLGPTFISTNSENKYLELEEIKKDLKKTL